MDNNRLLELLTKYQDHTCTDEELQEIEQWYQSLETDNQSVELTDAFAGEMLTQFRDRLRKPAVPFYKGKIFRVAAAAAAVILIGMTIFLLTPSRRIGGPVAIAQPTDFTAPAISKAYLTLSDGKRIYLDSLENGTVTLEGGTTIYKNGDQVMYSNVSGPEVKYNTLTVPKGSKPFKLLLADGSEMWLDAATTVTYPNTFTGNERRVEIITGQTYLEVAHNPKKPFKVKKGNTEVEVLGTHFNISAFENEEMKVTLLEGSVEVKNEKHKVRITPGQQAVVKVNPSAATDERLFIVNNVDLEAVMAWKEGNFQFEGAGINEVMQQLARWYDVEVEIKGNIPAHFGGTISREVNVSKVFEMLKLTGELNYKIEGRKIIITP